MQNPTPAGRTSGIASGGGAEEEPEAEMASALSSLRYGDSLSVVAISAATAVLCEAISWLLIYRTATYNSLSDKPAQPWDLRSVKRKHN